MADEFADDAAELGDVPIVDRVRGEEVDDGFEEIDRDATRSGGLRAVKTRLGDDENIHGHGEDGQDDRECPINLASFHRRRQVYQSLAPQSIKS